MSVFGKLFAGGAPEVAGEVVEKTLSGLDQLTTTAEELGAIKTALTDKLTGVFTTIVEQGNAEMDAVTKRHAADMAADNFLSKNFRPGIMVYSVIVISLAAFLDASSSSFELPQGYLEIFKGILEAGVWFYFGGRGVEKVVRVWKGIAPTTAFDTPEKASLWERIRGKKK